MNKKISIVFSLFLLFVFSGCLNTEPVQTTPIPTATPTSTATIEPSPSPVVLSPTPGVIEENIIVDLSPLVDENGPIVIDKRMSMDAALVPECGNESYLEERADYVVEAGVSSIEENSTDNSVSIDFGVVRWQKGDLDANYIRILRSSAKNSEDPVFDVNKIYRLYLWELEGQVYFVCGFMGVKDLSYENWYCYDSDGGRNYLEKGTARIFFNGTIYGPYGEACGNGVLDEVVCSNEGKYILSELYLCENGCSDGRCIE